MTASVVKAFAPRMVERLRSRIEVLVDELLDAVEARGAIDLVHDFAYPLAGGTARRRAGSPY